MTLPAGFTSSVDAALPLHAVRKADFAAWCQAQPAPVQAWLAAQRFDGAAGVACSWPDADGRVAGAVVGVDDLHDPFAWAHAPRALPAGDWRMAAELDGGARRALQLGWGLGLYRFARYKAQPAPAAQLAADNFDAETFDLLAACVRVRDLVNTPTEHMGPDELKPPRARSRRRTAPASRPLPAMTCWRRTTRPSTRSAAPRTARRASSNWAGATRRIRTW